MCFALALRVRCVWQEAINSNRRIDMPRKTTCVLDLLKWVNGFLASSQDDQKEARDSLCIMFENVLHKSGNYAGFNYLTADMVKEGLSYGVTHCSDGEHRFHDESRRFYFVHRNLSEDGTARKQS
jgi:hypothetical protein